MKGLFIPNLQLPRKGRWSTITIYPDGRCVYQFGGHEIGMAVQEEREDDE